MKNLVLMAAILMAYPVLGQEVKHAPTVAQCQADQALWYQRLTDATVADLALEAKDVTSSQLYGWFDEMADCMAVDRENAGAYNKTLLRILVVVGLRYRDFLKRHDLQAQFLKEDAAGER